MVQEQSRIENSSDPSPRSVHQLSGLDDRERGFNRQVQIISIEEQFQVRLRYEKLRVELDPVSTEAEALEQLARHLHGRGFRQLRTQQIFVEGRYLGSQERWVEYADPESPEPSQGGWESWFARFFKGRV